MKNLDSHDMKNLEMIDMAILATVTGGEGEGPNRTNIEGELDVQTPGVAVKGKGTYKTSRTDYASCLDVMRGQPPDQIRTTCGLPGGNVG